MRAGVGCGAGLSAGTRAPSQWADAAGPPLPARPTAATGPRQGLAPKAVLSTPCTVSSGHIPASGPAPRTVALDSGGPELPNRLLTARLAAGFPEQGTGGQDDGRCRPRAVLC